MLTEEEMNAIDGKLEELSGPNSKGYIYVHEVNGEFRIAISKKLDPPHMSDLLGKAFATVSQIGINEAIEHVAQKEIERQGLDGQKVMVAIPNSVGYRVFDHLFTCFKTGLTNMLDSISERPDESTREAVKPENKGWRERINSIFK